MSAQPPPEREPERLVVEARAEVEEEEDKVESTVDKALRGHPRLSAARRVVTGVLHQQTEERVGLAASGAAFWIVISIFPTAIAVVSVFGLVVSPERVVADLGRLANRAPGSLGSLVTDQLQRVAAADHARLSLGLAISVVLAVWSASAGVYNLDRAIRAAYGLPAQRYAEARGRALVGAVVVVMALGVSAIGISTVVGKSAATWVVVISVPILLVGIAAAVAALYRFSAGGGARLRALLPGAVGSAIGLVAVFVGFSAYVDWSKHYTAVYGVSAGAAVGMLGTYLGVYVVLLGAVLNVELSSSGRSRGSTRADDGSPPS